MSTVRFSLVTYATKSLVVEAWERVVSELFAGRQASKANRISRLYETRWESELKRLQLEVHFVCNNAISQLIPLAGRYEQRLLDTVLSAYTVYAPDEAESVFNEGNKAIEDISGHVTGIWYNADRMREANRQVDEQKDMHLKAVMYHNSVKPYMDTMRYHIDQLKAILQIA